MEFIIVTGPPYSGKGTQCELIEEHFNYKHVSTGDICRAEKAKNSSLGKIVSEYDIKGDLVPDHIMKELLSAFVEDNSQEELIILDGYPRTKKQVKDLEEILIDKQIEIRSVINIEVPKATLLERAKKRAETSDREDDKDPETHLKRIEIFQEETLPAIEYMKDYFKVDNLSGLGSINEIFQKVIKSIE